MVDPVRLRRACDLVGSSNASAVVDEALARLIDDEETRRHVESYLAQPDAVNEALGEHTPEGLDEWGGVSYEEWRRRR